MNLFIKLEIDWVIVCLLKSENKSNQNTFIMHVSTSFMLNKLHLVLKECEKYR